MDIPQPNTEQPPKRGRGRPCKNSILPSVAGPSSEHPPARGSSILADPKPKRKRGRPTKKRAPPSPPDEIIADGNTAPPTSNSKGTAPPTPSSEDTAKNPVRIAQHIPQNRRYTFSGLRPCDYRDWYRVQFERLLVDPEETVYLTDSDEEMDDSTDIEDGGLKEAEVQQKKTKAHEARLRESKEYNPASQNHKAEEKAEAPPKKKETDDEFYARLDNLHERVATENRNFYQNYVPIQPLQRIDGRWVYAKPSK